MNIASATYPLLPIGVTLLVFLFVWSIKDPAQVVRALTFRTLRSNTRLLLSVGMWAVLLGGAYTLHFLCSVCFR